MALILHIQTMPHFVFGSLFIWPKLSHNAIVKTVKKCYILNIYLKNIWKNTLLFTTFMPNN